ncbi:WD40 repeat-containing protein [Tieghemostelium lacteum]|uniref:Pre-mRNA-processing factor 17 n=1 Tax=Tieghemostelium lacteum TaxID=361077 RepID=A0A151Z4M6_TIELA|nr:WD40 repeat-containing protein [Tieghemostelium lacteum]|eukprot:KYQ88922.1 WD40 repeat-containing protein [Tieghemostelium lacteum]
MDLLKGNYNDSSDEEDEQQKQQQKERDNSNNIDNNVQNNRIKAEFKDITTFIPNLTPSVSDIKVIENKVSSDTRMLLYNPTVEQLEGETSGPIKPFSQAENPIKKNHVSGHIENYAMSDYSFHQQYHYQIHQQNIQSGRNDSVLKKRAYEDPSKVGQYKGTWKDKKNIVLSGPPTASNEDTGSGLVENDGQELSEEQKLYMESKLKKSKHKLERDVPEHTAQFHGDTKRDYMGRSWVEPPSDLKPDQEVNSYIPKRMVHTWSGHSKGVSAIRFFPRYGHLLLSCSMDSSVKIWDVNGDRRCMQTYTGHSQAVRDICFTNDGRQFLSAGFDRVTRLWDTETGQIISTFSNGKTPYCVKFNPDMDKQNLFLVGGSDKKILQYDVKSNEVVQEYDQHLGAINTITFIDDNRRFVSSSDDKSLRVWDWGIPVVIKYISDPSMHSMPAVTLHPKGKWFVASSLDNQLLVYNARDKFRVNKKKRFAGHLVSGYACQFGFSPDGKYLVSGDSTGKTYFWDWKSCSLKKTIQAHDQVCIDVEWHPLETSKVATCSWDGKIKYWD